MLLIKMTVKYNDAWPEWQFRRMTNKQYNVTLRSMTFSKMNCQQCHNLFPLILSITSSTLLFKMSFNWVPFCRKLWHQWRVFYFFSLRKSLLARVPHFFSRDRSTISGFIQLILKTFCITVKLKLISFSTTTYLLFIWLHKYTNVSIKYYAHIHEK